MQWYSKLSNAAKAAINTAWQSFAGAALLAVLGLFNSVQDWVNGGNIPDVSIAARGVASAAIAALAGLITYVVRAVQASKDESKGPQYPSP